MEPVTSRTSCYLGWSLAQLGFARSRAGVSSVTRPAPNDERTQSNLLLVR